MNAEKIVGQKSFINKEIRERKKFLAKAQETEGWSKLSEKQQKMLEISLFVQDRDNRRDRSKYLQSHEYVQKYYCHGAIYALENNFLFRPKDLKKEEETKIRTKDFYQTKYVNINYYEKSKKEILKHDFPCVLHLAIFDPLIKRYFNLEMMNDKKEDKENKNINGYWDSVIKHSLLVLGESKDKKEIVIWNKVGYCFDFEINNWRNTYYDYLNINSQTNKGEMAIGIRPLKNKEV
jgi:hypothetical protein